MPKSLAEAIAIADEYALGDPMQPSAEAVARNRRREPMNNRLGPRFNDRQEFGHKRREPDYSHTSNQVAAVSQDQPGAGGAQRPKTNGPAFNPNPEPALTYEAMIDGPCCYHTKDPRKPANHTTRQCSWNRRIREEGAKVGGNGGGPPPRFQPPQKFQPQRFQPRSNQNLSGANVTPITTAPEAARSVNVVNARGNNNSNGAGPSQQYEYPGNDYREAHASYVIFVTEPTDKQSVQRRAMEVSAVMPVVTTFMNWSEQEVTWSRKDTPRIMPSPGKYALVVDPTLCGPSNNVRFTRVLVDNGSAINIMYRDTMVKLGYSPNQLRPSSCTFHGIVPGVSCAPMGKIWVEVAFGTKDNCRVESIEFEVVDLESAYHALLGRPALAKFMISSHVAYLKMKMPGPKGIITISGDYKRAMQCASAGSNLAEALVIAAEKKKLHQVVAMAQSAQLGAAGLMSPDSPTSFEVPKETKRIPIDPEFPERMALIGAGLGEK